MNIGLCDCPEERALVCRNTSFAASSEDVCWDYFHRTMVLLGFHCCAGVFPGPNPDGQLPKAFTPPTSSPKVTHQVWVHSTSRGQLSWISAMTLCGEGTNTENRWQMPADCCWHRASHLIYSLH